MKRAFWAFVLLMMFVGLSSHANAGGRGGNVRFFAAGGGLIGVPTNQFLLDGGFFGLGFNSGTAVVNGGANQTILLEDRGLFGRRRTTVFSNGANGTFFLRR